jgi:hypothetical protein
MDKFIANINQWETTMLTRALKRRISDEYLTYPHQGKCPFRSQLINLDDWEAFMVSLKKPNGEELKESYVRILGAALKHLYRNFGVYATAAQEERLATFLRGFSARSKRYIGRPNIL